MLSGEPPVGIFEDEKARYRRGSGTCAAVLQLLDLVSTFGMDVPAELAAKAEREAREQAERVRAADEARRVSEENFRRFEEELKARSLARTRWWRSKPVSTLLELCGWLALVACFVLVLIWSTHRGR
jgi:arylsulfatase A-like enzyme